MSVQWSNPSVTDIFRLNRFNPSVVTSNSIFPNSSSAFVLVTLGVDLQYDPKEYIMGLISIFLIDLQMTHMDRYISA